MAVFTAISTAVAAYSAGASFLGAASAFFQAMSISFVGRLMLGVAGAAILRALAPKPSAPKVTGYTLTARGAAINHQVVYGQTRVAGAEVFKATTGTDNSYLHVVLAFTGHEIEEFSEIWINDKKATLDGNGNVTSVVDEEGNTETIYDGNLTIIKRLGGSDNATPPSFGSSPDRPTDAGWTSDHKLTGISYLYCRFKFNRDVFPNGVPEIQATIKGKKVYNPVTNVTEWSDNPALCLRDYLTNSTYGLGEAAANIDDDLIETAYNACNETATVTETKDIWGSSVTLGTKMFTCNGAFTTDSKPVDVLEDMLTSMGGALWYAQGKWRMKASKWSAPSVTFDEDDLRSNITVSTRHSTRDNFNVVKGIFRGIEANYVDTDYPEVRNVTTAANLVVGEKYVITKLGDTNWNTVAGTTGQTYNVGDLITVDAVGSGTGTADFNVGTDNGVKNVIDMSLPFTGDSVTARRIARIALERHRQQLSVSATFGMRAFNVQVGDTINLTNSRFGWSEKEFEVLSWTLVIGENLDVQVQMELRETAETAFDEVDDGVVYERDNTTLLSPFEVPSVTLNTPTIGTSVNSDGTVITHADFTWSVTDDSRISYYLFEYSFDLVNYNNIRLDGTRFRLTPLISGETYYYRVTPYNYLGVKGTSVDGVAGVLPTDDDTVPNVPTSPVVVGGYRTATVYWTEPTQNTDSSTLTDLLHYEVYRGTSSNPTTLIARVASNRFTDGDLLDSTTYYYRIKAVDRSANKSSFSDNASAATQSQLVDGVDGTNVATVYLFNKNTSNSSAPSDPSGTFTYTFSTGVLSGGTLNGWTQTPPSLSEGEYLWVIVATASSTTSTDSIPASEFTEATIYGQGTAAYRSAVVTLFKKNTSGTTPPSDPTGPFTYTFATNALSGGTLDGWSQSAPSLSKGEYLWSISATAFAQTTTDTVNTSDFGDAVVVGIGGEDGADGDTGPQGDAGDTGDTVVTGKVYYTTLQSSSPSTPSATSFNTSTGTFTGLTSGWSLTQPSVSITDTTVYEWSSQFVVTIDGVTSAQTITFTTPASAIQVTTDLESDNYVANTSGWKLERDTGDIFVNNGTFRGDIILGGRLDSTIFNHFYGYAHIGPSSVSSAFTYTTLTDDFDITATATGLDANANYLLIDFRPYIVQRMYNCRVHSWGGYAYVVGELQYYNSSNTWQTACIWWDNVDNISDRNDNDLNAKPAQYVTPIVGRGLDGVLDMGSTGQFRIYSYLSDTEPSPKDDPNVYQKFMQSNSAGNLSSGQVETKTVTYAYENNDGTGTNGKARHGAGFSGKLIQVNDTVLPSGGGYNYLGGNGGIGN